MGEEPLSPPPRILAVLPGLVPSTLISVVKPLVALHRSRRVRASVRLESLVRETEFAQADVVVFCRNTEPCFRHLIELCHRLKRPYIYDLDDNFFEVPLTLEAGRYHREAGRLEALGHYLRGASLVRVYSESVRRRVLDYNSEVEKVDGSLDWSLVPEPLPSSSRRPVGIVYATSRLDDELMAALVPDLEALLSRGAGEVDLTFWGAPPPAPLRGRKGVRHIDFDPDYDRFLRRLGRCGLEIGLAPLRNDEFHRSKTNNKFREYGACGIVGCYSDVEVYSSCVVDGETGLLVPLRPGAWLEALERLIGDPALRQRIRVAGREYVRRHYSQERTESEWLRQFRDVLGRSAVAGSSWLPPPGDGASPALGEVAARAWRAATLANRAGRFLQRIRRIGLRASLSSVHRYLSERFLLRRIQRSLDVSERWDGKPRSPEPRG